MTHTGLVARVLIDSPLPQLDHLFDYSIPVELEDIALPGVRVKVPFRAGRIADGYLIEVVDTAAMASAAAAAATEDSADGLHVLLGPGTKPAAEAAFSGKLSPLDSVVSPVQVLTPEVAKLARALADRAAGNASDVIRLAVPNRQVRAEKAWLTAREASAASAAATATAATAADAADAANEIQGSPVFASADTPSTSEIGRPIETASNEIHESPVFASSEAARTSENGRPIETTSPETSAVTDAPTDWATEAADTDATTHGSNEIHESPVLASAEATRTSENGRPFEPTSPGEARGLSAVGFDGYRAGIFDQLVAEQQRAAVAAVPRLVQLASGATVGHWARTLAELAAVTLHAGRSTLLVLPDYRDQDQVEAALAELVPATSISRVDARQTGAERYRAFLACLEPEPRIVIGNRSAVYAPAHNLGLIALWDDGDPLHAELHSPYVHARDAALVRQQESGCALAFFGHSRSVETQRLVELGWLGVIQPERVAHPKVIPTAYQGAPDEQARVARIPTAAWRAAKEALATGPVLVQVASPGYAPVLACQTCKQAARCTHCQGPLGLATAGATPSCRLCGALAVSWQCSHCEGRTYRLVTIGTGRTAEELGRAFPGVRVIIADGEHTIQHIDAQPALVIATRGAEPIPTGGYHAILLLDGERMLARESLRVGEDCLRWWSNAAALAAPGASVVLVGVGGALARALNTWQPEAYAASELADRRVLRFPPAVRIASVTGTDDGVATAVAEFTDHVGVDVLGPVPADAGKVRAVVRFAYSEGDSVAHTLKAAVVRNASQRRKRAAGSSAAFVPTPTLKVRFDDPELL